MTVQNASPPTDAVEVLLATRQAVAQLLDAYSALCARDGETAGEKLAIVERLSLDLTLATQVEEEILVPALHRAGTDLAALYTLHDSVWALVAQLSMGEPGDLHFDARLIAMGREVLQQLQRVHDTTLPRLPAAGLDLQRLGEEMNARQKALMAAFESAGEDESDDPVGRPVPDALR